MKKYIVSIALLLALPTLLLAAFQPATLVKGVSRVAVYTQAAAQSYFGQGYVLENDGKTALPNLGSGSGQDHYVPERFWAGFGGAVYATTTVNTAETITEGLLQKYSVFEITPLVGSLTWTLPATSTISNLLKNEGDTQRWIFNLATTTTGTTFTLAKGQGWDLTGIDANVDVIPGAAVGSQEYMSVECTRLKIGTSTYITMSGTIYCGIEEYLAAD